jgi:hypothetical protein
MKPSHGGNYEKDWGKCQRCECMRPARALVDGVCSDNAWCLHTRHLRSLGKGVIER